MSSNAIRLGKIFGFEIELDYSWFIILAIFSYIFSQTLRSYLSDLSTLQYFLLGLMSALLLFLSVLLHELAHSVFSRKYGLGISGITLFLFGGVSKLVKEPHSARSEFVISVAGPVVSFVLAGFFYGAFYLASTEAPRAVFLLTGRVNLALAIFNLMPGLPLDGGRILRAFIWQVTGNFANATRVASVIGQVLGYMLIFLGVMGLFSGAGLQSLWPALIGWFLVQAAQSSYQQSVLRRFLSGHKVASVMTEEVVTVEAEMNLEEVVNDYFLKLNYTAFPVMREGKVAGMIHLSDVRAVPREKWSTTTAGEIAPELREGQVVPPEEDAWEAMAKMAAQGEGRLLVMQGEELRGILSRSNIMRLFRTKMELGG